MCTMVRELWLTGWKGKKGGLHKREREVRSTGNTIVTKDRRWLWGLQYFCYGTLNSYEFSNATTAVNNGESARNNGGRNTPGWARETHFLPPFSRSAYFSSSSSLEFGGSRNRSIDRSIDFCFSSRLETSLQEKKKSNRSVTDWSMFQGKLFLVFPACISVIRILF